MRAAVRGRVLFDEAGRCCRRRGCRRARSSRCDVRRSRAGRRTGPARGRWRDGSRHRRGSAAELLVLLHGRRLSRRREVPARGRHEALPAGMRQRRGLPAVVYLLRIDGGQPVLPARVLQLRSLRVGHPLRRRQGVRPHVGPLQGREGGLRILHVRLRLRRGPAVLQDQRVLDRRVRERVLGRDAMPPDVRRDLRHHRQGGAALPSERP